MISYGFDPLPTSTFLSPLPDLKTTNLIPLPPLRLPLRPLFSTSRHHSQLPRLPRYIPSAVPTSRSRRVIEIQLPGGRAASIELLLSTKPAAEPRFLSRHLACAYRHDIISQSYDDMLKVTNGNANRLSQLFATFDYADPVPRCASQVHRYCARGVARSSSSVRATSLGWRHSREADESGYA